jgi:hypothetical protein
MTTVDPNSSLIALTPPGVCLAPGFRRMFASGRPVWGDRNGPYVAAKTNSAPPPLADSLNALLQKYRVMHYD